MRAKMNIYIKQIIAYFTLFYEQLCLFLVTAISINCYFYYKKHYKKWKYLTTSIYKINSIIFYADKRPVLLSFTLTI